MNDSPHSHITSELKAQGYRITIARKEIISIFETIQKPITADELNDLLIDKMVFINKSTIYREIDFLGEQTIIKPIQFQGKTKYYELANMHHHHHLICTICHNIEDFEHDNCLADTKLLIANSYGFTIQDHILDFYGICKQCKQ
jgi:Fur family transcriptional regulator, ferric uptake regulator